MPPSPAIDPLTTQPSSINPGGNFDPRQRPFHGIGLHNLPAWLHNFIASHPHNQFHAHNRPPIAPAPGPGLLQSFAGGPGGTTPGGGGNVNSGYGQGGGGTFGDTPGGTGISPEPTPIAGNNYGGNLPPGGGTIYPGGPPDPGAGQGGDPGTGGGGGSGGGYGIGSTGYGNVPFPGYSGAPSVYPTSWTFMGGNLGWVPRAQSAHGGGYVTGGGSLGYGGGLLGGGGFGNGTPGAFGASYGYTGFGGSLAPGQIGAIHGLQSGAVHPPSGR